MWYTILNTVINCAGKPILGGEVEGSAPRTPIAQHSTLQESAPQTTPVTETRPTSYTESRPVEGATSGGPAGLPSGYAARGVNPDNVNVNYAGEALFHNDCVFHSVLSSSACLLFRCVLL